jgi:hypothetical protein
VSEVMELEVEKPSRLGILLVLQFDNFIIKWVVLSRTSCAIIAASYHV